MRLIVLAASIAVVALALLFARFALEYSWGDSIAWTVFALVLFVVAPYFKRQLRKSTNLEPWQHPSEAYRHDDPSKK